MASEHFLTLRPDGTYEQQGMTSVAMTVEGGGGRTGIAGSTKKTPDHGTYAFEGYTLTLKPAGGPPQKLTAYLQGDDDGLLVLNDTPYLKPDAKK